MNKKLSVLWLFVLINLVACSQTTPFGIYIEPFNINGLGGIQSYAYGQADNKWLIVGGRLDGLHQRQPFAAFDQAGHNNQLIVIDPVSEQKWSAPLSSLPTSIQEQLSSTNMQFYQEGAYLYCIGGYGYSATAGDHTTYSNLTAIKVPDVINAVISNSSFTSYFRQISDPKFQVTGGKLKKINDDFYLLGGQKFIGRYNPMGPNHGPGFIQEYTNAIRKFYLLDDGTNISITHLPSHQDSVNLHRRDYNAEAQILPNGEEGITMFSGVFQQNIDLPFLNSVTVDDADYTVDNTFQQYYNHYHCATLPIYAASENEMHNVFFGGIAQFYDSLGILVQDNNVPFVSTIARVTRNANGTLVEYKLPIEMPTLLGAGSEFIPNKNIPHYPNEVVKLDSITSDTTLAGYIYGGISSTGRNIFFINNGTQSSASSQIFKVYIVKNVAVGIDDLNEHSISDLQVKVFPNPSDGDLVIKFNLSKIEETKMSIFSIDGKLIEQKNIENLKLGENIYQAKTNKIKYGGTYLLVIETPNEKSTQKIIIK